MSRSRLFRLLVATLWSALLALLPTNALATKVKLVGSSTPGTASNCIPFGGYSGGSHGFVYKNVPAFTLRAGDTIAFDLGGVNDVDLTFDIGFATAISNGSNQPNTAGFTDVVSYGTASSRGDTAVGNFETVFTATSAFTFGGGGLIVRFKPQGSMASDTNCTPTVNTYSSSDASGYFVGRFYSDSDGVYPWTGSDSGSIGAMRIQSGLPIRVAVERGPSSTSTGADVVTQLNDDTYFDFTATLVTVDQIDTAAELARYDVVIIGDSGSNNNDWNATTTGPAWQAAQKAWVASGGSVVSTGWSDYPIDVETDLDAVVPFVASGSWAYCSGTGTVTMTTTHPVTFGVPSVTTTTSTHVEYISGALDTGSVKLGTRWSSTSCTGATTDGVVVAGNHGIGNTVYLGFLYNGVSTYNPTDLRTGAADRLLEQAVAWASGYTESDADADGDPDVLDCDDGSASIYRGATETCDGIDNDCDGTIDEGLTITYYRDADGDGYGTGSALSGCSVPSGYVTKAGDCNDSNNAIYPGRAEVCDGVDQDCDSVADDGLTTYTYYRDADGDGYGAGTASSGCSIPSGYDPDAGDCNDSNAAIYPGRAEICDGVDQDCDGTPDDGLTTYTYYTDADGDGYGTGTAKSGCSVPSGHSTANGDCNDSNNAIYPTRAEVCDGVDQDCDGTPDDGLTTYTYYVDGDKDGYGSTTTATMCYSTAPSGYSTRNDDCDDAVATTHPGATETCNSVDDDCNGTADDGVTILYYADDDGDTYGDPSTSAVGCSAPSGYVLNKDDCDDTRPTVKPGGTEVCNSLDDDCDGTVDDGVKTTYYADSDGDTFGNVSVTQQACSAPTGYVTNSTDCNDSDASIRPTATETCNSKDDDCDGTIDEGVKTTYYRDADSDGWGRTSSSQQACSAPSGYVAKSGDCDDTRNTVNPDGTEVCNELDDDCDSTVDDGVTTTYYVDADGDSYGSTTTTQACSLPSGHSTNSTDCNDAVATTYPGAPEACDGVDNDCDSAIDETAPTWYVDSDSDGFGSSASTSVGCTAPTGYVGTSTDCDDANAAINPDAVETCNTVDDDCNGTVDDGVGTTFYADTDGDGFGDPANIEKACSGTPTGYVSNATDCDDTRDSVYPGADEVCNELDDDCNDIVDDDASDASSWYTDADGDGFGVTATETIACDPPTTESVTAGGDCADADDTIFPGALETPDGVDEDCDGIVDNGTVAYDDDGDGYTEDGGDCDDTDPSRSPAETEVCDSLDQNCDGITDEGTECYDDDGDGWLEIDGDCNDTDPSVAPDATEVPDNGIDDDCDGEIDEFDRDGDGYADDIDCEPDNASVHPDAPEIPNGFDEDCDDIIDEGTVLYDDDGDGYTENEGDCNDADADVSPDGVETADGVDEDCDDIVDEGTEAYDDDGDGYTEQGGDCADDDAAVNPGVDEVADNGLDDDCDGSTDEAPGSDEDIDGDGFTGGLGDCDDGNDLVYPNAYEICDDLDNDCNGSVDDNPVCESGGGKCGCAAGPVSGLGMLPFLFALGLRRRAYRPVV